MPPGSLLSTVLRAMTATSKMAQHTSPTTMEDVANLNMPYTTFKTDLINTNTPFHGFY